MLKKVDKTPHVYRYLKCRHFCALVSSDYAQQDVKHPSINQLQAQTYSVCFAISIYIIIHVNVKVHNVVQTNTGSSKFIKIIQDHSKYFPCLASTQKTNKKFCLSRIKKPRTNQQKRIILFYFLVN